MKQRHVSLMCMACVDQLPRSGDSYVQAHECMLYMHLYRFPACKCIRCICVGLSVYSHVYGNGQSNLNGNVNVHVYIPLDIYTDVRRICRCLCM